MIEKGKAALKGCMALFAVALMGWPTPTAAAPAEATVYVIPIRGAIESALVYVVRRGVQEAERTGADALVFVMDTPGGTLDAAGKIIRMIQGIQVPTYTLVENHAFSAGALIALATRHIYMAPGSVIGDAMPMMMSPLGGPQEPSEAIEEKMISAVAALARAAAEQGGHDKELAEAMVRREIEYSIDDEVIAVAGQLLTLTNVEAERLVGPDQRPLLSSGTVDNLENLLDTIGLSGARIKELQVTHAERIARFIAALAPLLLIAGLLGVYVEIRTPGFGLPGLLGAVALAAFFWGHHVAGLAGMEHLALFAVGVALLLVELLLIPGFGITGIAGLLLIFWSLLLAMADIVPPRSPWLPSWDALRGPLMNLSLALIGTVAGAALLGRFLPSLPLYNQLVLGTATTSATGYTAATAGPRALGHTAIALSDLRPSGIARLGEERIDVISDGEYLPKGSRLRIVEARGNRYLVEAAAAEPAAPPPGSNPPS